LKQYKIIIKKVKSNNIEYINTCIILHILVEGSIDIRILDIMGTLTNMLEVLYGCVYQCLVKHEGTF